MVWGFAVGTTLWGTWYALRQFQSRRREPEVLPPVSVLKPLKGVDGGLVANIRCFFELDYPEYELLFSVGDADDPACEVVRNLQRRHPRVKSRLFIGLVDLGPNPKVNNLVKSYDSAAHDLILISDSNVRVKRDYLRRVVSHLQPGVGVVTAVVAGRNGRGLGGWLETTYLNSFYARWMHLSSAVGHSFVVGKSMLFRRSTLERLGGLRNFGQYIAEDYMAGQAMRRIGLSVKIMSDPIQQHVGAYGFTHFWSRHLRWGRIRKAQAPLAFCVEPLLGSLMSGILGGLVFQSWLDVPFWWFFSAHVALWMGADLLLMTRLEDKLKVRMFLAWVIREVLALPLWLHMASGSSVNWRGNRLKILPGGLLDEIGERRS